MPGACQYLSSTKSPIKISRTITWNKSLLANALKALIAIFCQLYLIFKTWSFNCSSASTFSTYLPPPLSPCDYICIWTYVHIYNIPRHFSVSTTVFARNYFEPLSNQLSQKSRKLHRDLILKLSRINCNVADT